MSILKNLFGRINPNELNLSPFYASDLRIEWESGNNLKITFTTDSYIRKGDTITVNAPITFDGITPGVVYDAGIKKEARNDY